MWALMHGADVRAQLGLHFGCIEHGQNLVLALPLAAPSSAACSYVYNSFGKCLQSTVSLIVAFEGSFEEEASSQLLA